MKISRLSSEGKEHMMPQENKVLQTEPNFNGGLPAGSEIVLLKEGKEILKTDVSWFDSFLDKENCPEDWPIQDLKILGSTGWTEIVEIARRNFWEHETAVTISVRKGKARFACGTVVPIIRSGKTSRSEVEHLTAGDTLIMHDYMMLRNGHTDPKKQVIIRHQGVMDKKKSPAEGISLYLIRTASGDVIADGIVTFTGTA